MEPNSRAQERSDLAGNNAESPAASKTTSGIVQIDPAASAALAEAIRAAKQSRKKDENAGSPALDIPVPEFRQRPASPSIFGTPRLAQVAMAVVLVGAGWSAAYFGTLANKDAIHKLSAETARSQEILTRLGGDLETLKGTLATFKQMEQASANASAADQEKLAEKVDRLAVELKAPGTKLTALESRLDRMESQIMTTLADLNAKTSAPSPANPSPSPAAINTEAPASKPAKAEPVDGWVLLEVYRGAALVEGRNRRLYEVMPGGTLPGVGRVEGIERRGNGWVVVTDKGYISTYR